MVGATPINSKPSAINADLVVGCKMPNTRADPSNRPFSRVRRECLLNCSLLNLRGHEHVVESVAFISEEAFPKINRENKHNDTVRDYLASGSRDRSVRLWKVSSGECLAVFNSHENWVRGVLIHPNGKYILSCGDDRSIRVFDIQVCIV